MTDLATMTDIESHDSGTIEQTQRIGCLPLADSGDVVAVDVIHRPGQPEVIRVAGSRLTPPEAAALAELLLAARKVILGAREGI